MRGSKLITPAVLVDIDGTLADSRERPTIHVVSYTSHTNPEELLESGDIQA